MNERKQNAADIQTIHFQKGPFLLQFCEKNLLEISCETVEKSASSPHSSKQFEMKLMIA